MRPAASPLAVWAGIFVLYVVWGSTYLGMKVAIDTLPVFMMGFFRFSVAGVLLTVAIVVRERGAVRMPARGQWRDTAIVGTMLLLGGTGFVAWGEQTVQTGIAALLIGLVPMWLAVFGRVLFGDRIPPLVAVGVLIGLAGVAILAWPVGGVGQLDPGGLVALLASSLLWSLGSLYAARRAVMPVPALFATGLQMIIGGLAFLAAAAITGELWTFDPAAVSLRSWSGVGYLVLVGSLVGYTTYAWLLTVAPLSRIATYAYVNPVVAVVLGWLLLGEPLTVRTGIAAAVIVAAVALIVTARGRADRARQATPLPAAEPMPEPATIT